MKRILIAIGGFSTLVILAGCGGNDRNPATAKRDSPAAANRNSAAPAGSNADQPPAGGNDAGNTNAGAENPLTAGRGRKLDTMRQSATNSSAPPVDLEAILKRSAKPAPENSEFSVALTDVLFERRIFHDHPVLVRVEKIADNSRSTIKVFTTDGRTTELPGNAIEKLSVVSVAAILRAARIEAPPSRPVDRKAGAANRN